MRKWPILALSRRKRGFEPRWDRHENQRGYAVLPSPFFLPRIGMVFLPPLLSPFGPFLLLGGGLICLAGLGRGGPEKKKRRKKAGIEDGAFRLLLFFLI